jgi:hypothetical protein
MVQVHVPVEGVEVRILSGAPNALFKVRGESRLVRAFPELIACNGRQVVGVSQPFLEETWQLRLD